MNFAPPPPIAQRPGTLAALGLALLFVVHTCVQAARQTLGDSMILQSDTTAICALKDSCPH